MELNKENEEEVNENIAVPNITGLTIKEAEKIVKELGIEIKIDEKGIDKANTIIKEQIPKQGIEISKKSKIIIKY